MSLVEIRDLPRSMVYLGGAMTSDGRFFVVMASAHEAADKARAQMAGWPSSEWRNVPPDRKFYNFAPDLFVKRTK